MKKEKRKIKKVKKADGKNMNIAENKDKKNMNDSDGIIISDKATWEHTFKELWAILGKRVIALPSKMIGFKPLCLYIATWLLVKGLIKDWIWFFVLVIVLFGIMGLKIVSKWKEH